MHFEAISQETILLFLRMEQVDPRAISKVQNLNKKKWKANREMDRKKIISGQCKLNVIQKNARRDNMEKKKNDTYLV